MARLSPHPMHFETVPMDPRSSFHLMHWRNGRGYDMHLHYHPEIELTLIVAGRGMRFIGDSVQPFEDGDLCLVGESLLHTWHAPRTQHTETLVIQFAPAMLMQLGEQWAELRRLPELIARSSRGLAYTGQSRRHIAEMMMRTAAAPPGSARRFGLMLELLEELHRARQAKPISAAPPLPASGDSNLARFRRVMQRLHESMPDAPAQAEMAEFAGMTPAGFARFFKRLVGKSYLDYVNAWRIGLACRQLLHSDAPITCVALDCGFENLSNFNRRFRQYKGSTPREYRRMARMSE